MFDVFGWLIGPKLRNVISWPISVIVEARSQLEHATKDKFRW